MPPVMNSPRSEMRVLLDDVGVVPDLHGGLDRTRLCGWFAAVAVEVARDGLRNLQRIHLHRDLRE